MSVKFAGRGHLFLPHYLIGNPPCGCVCPEEVTEGFAYRCTRTVGHRGNHAASTGVMTVALWTDPPGGQKTAVGADGSGGVS